MSQPSAGGNRTLEAQRAIWVIADMLTKLAHLLRVKMTYTTEDYAKLYIDDIVRLNGVPISIISDR